MSPFKQRVIQIVRAVPRGKIVSYGQVALYAGAPRAAREVGWVLHATEGSDLPWWRVINKAGVITIRGALFVDKEIQKKLLVAEGVEVSDSFKVDMKKYRFVATDKQLREFELPEEYIGTIIRQKGF